MSGDSTFILVIQLGLSLVLAPLVPGVVTRVKAAVAGRHGQPLLQAYFDIAKLFSKGSVYSRTTSWIFRAGPSLGCAAALGALVVLPWGAASSLLSFEGDLILFAGLFGLMRFLTILAALDTGSAFEGMGASREAWFSALAEPALLLGLASLAGKAQSLSLAAVLAGPGIGGGRGAVVLLAAGALFIVFLSENARIPVDDPATHLELTMIHEVMILDHSGIDLAYIQYASCLKLWALGGLVVAILRPRTGTWLADLAIAFGGILCVGIATGLIESFIARLRLTRVPQLLVAAGAMSALALALSLVR
ncbi:MAG TPA: NADH-quinone oxidoreductase subunit H [Spirochaetia bacterium]|nr:NADH-quinone oxidoreductase subunit H [Spirochaetia bacterium]